MATDGGDLQRAIGGDLAFHVGEVGVCRGLADLRRRQPDPAVAAVRELAWCRRAR